MSYATKNDVRVSNSIRSGEFEATASTVVLDLEKETTGRGDQQQRNNYHQEFEGTTTTVPQQPQPAIKSVKSKLNIFGFIRLETGIDSIFDMEYTLHNSPIHNKCQTHSAKVLALP